MSSKNPNMKNNAVIIIGKNAKIIPKVWSILMYLLFKNFGLVILLKVVISKIYTKSVIKNNVISRNNISIYVTATPQKCSEFPIIYVIYNSGQTMIQKMINTIHPQIDKKLKLYLFLNLSKNIMRLYNKIKGENYAKNTNNKF